MINSLFSKTISIISLLLLMSSSAFAGDWHTNEAGYVLDGHDAVAYQTANKAVKGSEEHKLKYEGGIFLFSSAENRDTFKADPAKYAPKYKGYCAFAMATKGAKVPANADTFKMYNGELLVFFNDMYEGSKFNTIVPWNGGEKDLYKEAEKNWKGLN